MKKLLYRFHNFKYRYKLMILILIAGIIPTLIVTCYMQMGMMNTLKKREMENMQESLKQAVDAIDNQAQIYENLIDYLSYSGDLRKVLKMERASDFNTYLKYTQVADPLLNMPQVYHKEIKGITLYADNIQVAHGSTLAPLSEIQGENWYPRNNRSLIRWYVQTGSQNKVIVARKFYDGSSEINAVLKITLDYNKLFEPFEKIMESDFAGIVWDENGNVVYSCNKIPAKYETGKVDTISEVQKSFSSVTKEMEGNQWKFCYFCPTDTIMESARYLMLKNLPLLTACILLIGILSYFFSRRLVCKLEQLTENMNQIHSGIREVTVQSDSKDEIGVLIRTFRRMMDEINKLTKNNSKYLSGGGTNVEMDGVQACAYARIRYTAGDDYKRTERQRTVLTAMVQKAQKANLTTINSLIDELFGDIKTSFSNTELISLAAKVFNYSLGETIGFPFEKNTTTLGNKGSVVVPCDLESNVKQLHVFLYDDNEYAPTDTVKNNSAQIVNDTGFHQGEGY